jgi:hypothetical protein
MELVEKGGKNDFSLRGEILSGIRDSNLTSEIKTFENSFSRLIKNAECKALKSESEAYLEYAARRGWGTPDGVFQQPVKTCSVEIARRRD